MRIGIDIDDTICSTWELLVELFCKDYNLNKNDYIYNPKSYDAIMERIGVDEYTRIIREYIKKYMLEIPLKENVKEVINELSKDNEIIFITSRNSIEFKDPFTICREYLEKNGIHYDKVIADIYDKGIVCRDEKIDLFIDDKVVNCKSVSEQGIDVLLFTALYNKSCNEYKRVNSWVEVKEYIDSLNR